MNNPSELNIKTLSNLEWVDNDIVLLHACFSLLEDCIENEKLFANWEVTNEESHQVQIEIAFLHNWWKSRKNIVSGFHSDEDIVQYENDNEMLIRLIKVRKFLWT